MTPFEQVMMARMSFQNAYNVFGVIQNPIQLGLISAQGNTTIPDKASPIQPLSISSGQMSSQLSFIKGYIQSANYVPSTTGWRLNADGTSDIN